MDGVFDKSLHGLSFSNAGKPKPSPNSLICFSHLRWNFVFQRPQHLLLRAARAWRVFFWEEPEWREGAEPHVRLTQAAPNLAVALPVLTAGMGKAESIRVLRRLLHRFVAEQEIMEPLLWYYYAAGACFLGPVARAGDRLRLHGRALGVPAR